MVISCRSVGGGHDSGVPRDIRQEGTHREARSISPCSRASSPICSGVTIRSNLIRDSDSVCTRPRGSAILIIPNLLDSTYSEAVGCKRPMGTDMAITRQGGTGPCMRCAAHAYTFARSSSGLCPPELLDGFLRHELAPMAGLAAMVQG